MATIANKPVALVTGASSGIGYEFAKTFAQHGFDLVIAAENDVQDAAREIEKLGANVHAVQVDLSTYEGVEQLYAESNSFGRPIDALVLNAGTGVYGDFARDTKLEDEIKIVELNVTSVVHLVKRVTRDMVSRKSGRVLITSSIAATMPSPLESVYGASKAFDLAFAASLRRELDGTGVTVTALEPGPTDTPFFEKAGAGHTKAAQSAKENSPADVARQGFDAMMSGKERVVGATSMMTKLQGMLARFVPESVKAKLHRKEMEPAKK